MLAFRGGGTNLDDGQPNIHIGGLTCHPHAPEVVYLGVHEASRDPRVKIGLGVRVSRDAGASWSDSGRADIGAVSDLTLGIDGKNLYAVTDQGVFRIRLSE